MHRERILEYRDESQRLDQCSRLYDSSVSNEGFEQDASHIVQVNSLIDQFLFCPVVCNVHAPNSDYGIKKNII